ncbi:hypothetical protein HPB51_004118 [Rhipicephalus microplus]|uniref:Uncharacterized protein n=1 Tax=Rhipicephalus microplus TaxID=6941 RepID=A0A9J6DKM2_RHIMP|nr:hypothetical protein HPB51_004118 [Rhipicephalus microplus]
MLSTITLELRSLRTLVQELRVENAALRKQLAQQHPSSSLIHSDDLHANTTPTPLPNKRKAPDTEEPATLSSQPPTASAPISPVQPVVPQQQLHETIQTVLEQQLPITLEQAIAPTLERSLDSILTAKLEHQLTLMLDGKLEARATNIQNNLEATLSSLLASYNSRVTELERCTHRARSHSHQKPYGSINQDGHLTKAFDNVLHSSIFAALATLNVSTRTYRYIRNFLRTRQPHSRSTICLHLPSLSVGKGHHRGRSSLHSFSTWPCFTFRHF